MPVTPGYFGWCMSNYIFLIRYTFSISDTIIMCWFRSEQRLRQHSSIQNSIPNNKRQISPSQNSNSTEGPSISSATVPGRSIRIKDQRDVKAKRNEWRITKMVLAIFLAFLICYLPITIAKIIDKDVHFPILHIMGYILIYLSACINPIIYVILNKQYRLAYKTVLLCKAPRLLSFTHAGSSAAGKFIFVPFNH